MSYNSEADNIKPRGTFQVQKRDILVSNSTRYLVMDFIGEGSFGKVAKCLNLTTCYTVAVKIYTQKEEDLIQEVDMLEANRALDPEKNNTVRFVESFRFNDLSCLVVEMLDMSLMDPMREQSPVGLCEKDALTENFSGRKTAIERFNAQDHVEPANIINNCDGDTGDLNTGPHNAYNSEPDNIEPIGTFQVQKYGILVSNSTRYLVMDFIGDGAFGKVAKCLNLTTTEMVAVKLHTQKEEEFIQREVCMPEETRALDPETNNRIRFVECFWYSGLSCLVFEILDRSLFDLMIQRKEAPLRINSLTHTKTDMELTEDSLADLFRGCNADFEMYSSEYSIEILPQDNFGFFSVDDDYSGPDFLPSSDEDTGDLDSGSHNAYNSEADNINPSRPYQVERNDILVSDSTRYLVVDFSGEGGFGKVAQCVNLSTNERVAVKFHTRNKERAIKREVCMLEAIRVLDPEKNNIVRFVESFRFNNLSFMVFEMLDRSLWDLVMENRTPLRLNEIRPVIHQLLVAFDALKSISVIHTDLKPDNIMLVNHKDQPYRVKLIDFGLAIPAHLLKTGNTVQPCGYRAPEAILGLPLSEAIDMWGVGCIIAFLCFGQHLFPIDCLYHCMTTMVQMLGQPEDHLLSAGIKSLQYFSKEEDSSSPGWRLKSPEEFKNTTGTNPRLSSNFLDKYKDLESAVQRCHPSRDAVEYTDSMAFLSLLKSCLHLDPSKRITPKQALKHPFITMTHLVNEKDTHSYACEAHQFMADCHMHHSDEVCDSLTYTKTDMESRNDQPSDFNDGLDTLMQVPFNQLLLKTTGQEKSRFCFR